jgi:hypothetical protein
MHFHAPPPPPPPPHTHAYTCTYAGTHVNSPTNPFGRRIIQSVLNLHLCNAKDFVLLRGGGLQRLLRRSEGFSGPGSDRSLVWQRPKGGLVLPIPHGRLGPRFGDFSERVSLHEWFYGRLLYCGNVPEFCGTLRQRPWCYVTLWYRPWCFVTLRYSTVISQTPYIPRKRPLGFVLS